LEVYGFKQATLDNIDKQLSINKAKINKINLNTADAEKLKNHPYLNYKQANAIIKYRKQHGNFQSLEKLNKIYALPKATIEKIKPYLSL
jgi:competence protein ComEA